jgi:carbon monoxide dehydrogenase subunit G
MMYRKLIDVACGPAEAFAYVSDFSRVAEWDPAVVEARALGDASPVGVGSRFELVALFRGKRQRFEYVVSALDEGRRIQLVGEGEKARSRDTISVESVEGTTHVTYEAQIQLKGLLRVAEPLLGATFRRMGDDALDGLQQRLGGR